jgi:3-hydroxymyristoyl/3-hydroxydecanoyl-(acyl carrier protein) dehydratase
MLEREVIEQLIPHRPPFLMVESVVDYSGGDSPTLRAERQIHKSEPVFSAGKSSMVWPSLYVIEGLGQCSTILSIIWAGERSIGIKENNKVKNASHLKEWLPEILKQDRLNMFSVPGLLASVDVELVDRVRASELLRYQVQLTRTHGELSHFAVSAHVDERLIAQGALVGMRRKSLEAVK